MIQFPFFKGNNRISSQILVVEDVLEIVEEVVGRLQSAASDSVVNLHINVSKCILFRVQLHQMQQGGHRVDATSCTMLG